MLAPGRVAWRSGRETTKGGRVSPTSTYANGSFDMKIANRAARDVAPSPSQELAPRITGQSSAVATVLGRLSFPMDARCSKTDQAPQVDRAQTSPAASPCQSTRAVRPAANMVTSADSGCFVLPGFRPAGASGGAAAPKPRTSPLDQEVSTSSVRSSTFVLPGFRPAASDGEALLGQSAVTGANICSPLQPQPQTSHVRYAIKQAASPQATPVYATPAQARALAHVESTCLQGVPPAQVAQTGVIPVQAQPVLQPPPRAPLVGSAVFETPAQRQPEPAPPAPVFGSAVVAPAPLRQRQLEQTVPASDEEAVEVPHDVLVEVAPFPEPVKPTPAALPAPHERARRLYSQDRVEGVFFTMTICRSEGVDLGIDLSHADGGRSLVVEGMEANGAISAWNNQQGEGSPSNRAVRIGDRIVRINDIINDADKMIEECRTNFVLQIGVQRA